MILQALVDYYDRRARDPDPARRLPALGFEDKAIPFVIEIDEAGTVVQLLDTRRLDGKRHVPQSFLVPQGEKKTSGVKANLLWDSAEYVVGLDRGRNADPEASPCQAFRQRIEALPEPARRDAGILAVLEALRRADWSKLTVHAAWPIIVETNPVMTFALASDRGALVCQRAAVVAAATSDAASAPRATCLVDGIEAPVARLHPAVRGVRGAQTSGANIVSFNAPAFESYGKRDRQGENAPIGERATFAYTTALNALLDRGSPNRIQIGDATTVIWCDRNDALDAELAAIFGDDPDAGVECVKQRLEGARRGELGVSQADATYFVLGLAPNAARLAVRFWLREPLERLGPRILQHFDDLRIARQSDRDPRTPSLFSLLCSIAIQRKADNIPAKIAGDWMRSILEGVPYPSTLLSAAVTRCRAEQSIDQFGGNVPYLRAAILKACINRDHRRRHGLAEHYQYIKEELDVTQTEPAYLLGRMFAVLERIQHRAQPGIKATIRDRYYGAASSTPAAVFPTLLRLEKAHLNKLGDAEAAFHERLIGEICGKTEAPLLSDFPRHLDLHDQGLFALGYYHQRQSLFTRRDTDSVTPPESNIEEN